MAFKHLLQALALLVLGVMPQPAGAGPLQIVGFGDSLMAGYQLAPGDRFTDQLEKALRDKGFDVSVANAGVSGDTTSGGLARLDWSVPDGTALVILEFGGNDMLRGIDPALVDKNLDAMLSRLKERDIPVLLAGMVAAPNLGHAYGEAFGAIYPRLAEKYGVSLYPFFLEGVAGNPALQLEDAMHPNAAGVKRIVEGILPMVEKAVSTSQSKS
jgi:acyl-CoA thioesterase-1